MERLFAEVDKGSGDSLTKLLLDQIERKAKLSKRTIEELKGSLQFIEYSTMKPHTFGYACS
jgi:hypothetical protein